MFFTSLIIAVGFMSKMFFGVIADVVIEMSRH
jgi:hypothetical protein